VEDIVLIPEYNRCERPSLKPVSISIAVIKEPILEAKAAVEPSSVPSAVLSWYGLIIPLTHCPSRPLDLRGAEAPVTARLKDDCYQS